MAQGRPKREGREEAFRVCSAFVSLLGARKECRELHERSVIMNRWT